MWCWKYNKRMIFLTNIPSQSFLNWKPNSFESGCLINVLSIWLSLIKGLKEKKYEGFLPLGLCNFLVLRGGSFFANIVAEKVFWWSNPLRKYCFCLQHKSRELVFHPSSSLSSYPWGRFNGQVSFICRIENEEKLHLWKSFTKVIYRVSLLIELTFWIWLFFCIFIGPESDHWECLSLTNSLTHSLTAV